MKFIAILFCFILSFNRSTEKNNTIQTGLYAVYLDISTYTELNVNADSTFTFLHRGLTGIGWRNQGKWKIRHGKLVLYDYEKKSLQQPNIWKIKKGKIINTTQNILRKGMTLELQMK
jgi:hypothetical protein